MCLFGIPSDFRAIYIAVGLEVSIHQATCVLPRAKKGKEAKGRLWRWRMCRGARYERVFRPLCDAALLCRLYAIPGGHQRAAAKCHQVRLQHNVLLFYPLHLSVVLCRTGGNAGLASYDLPNRAQDRPNGPAGASGRGHDRQMSGLHK